MTSFVFDECFNDKRVIAVCNSQGLCQANRYPKTLIGKKDYDMLPVVLSGSDPLVTIDYDMLDEHAAFVPAKNAGVIIVRYVVIKKLMKTKDAAVMLSNFKSKFKDWDKQNWQGIRLEITEEGVIISRVFDKASGPTTSIHYDDVDFEAKIMRSFGEISTASMKDEQPPLTS